MRIINALKEGIHLLYQQIRKKIAELFDKNMDYV